MEKVRGRGLVAVRMRMVECGVREGVTEGSRRYGMSRPTPYKLMARYQAEGVGGAAGPAPWGAESGAQGGGGGRGGGEGAAAFSLHGEAAAGGEKVLRL